MKTLLRSVVSVLALFMLVASSVAASPADAPPRGWIGVFLDGSDATGPTSVNEGVRVRGVVDGGPADDARIRAKDSIVAIDGSPVNGAADLMARLRELTPGSFVKLSLKRGGHDIERTTVLGSRSPSGDRFRFVRGWVGVDAIELPASLRVHFGAPEDAGILVSRVSAGSPADLSGIQLGDVIYEADGQSVTSTEGFSEIVNGGGVENTIDVVLARDGARIIVEPRIERAP